VRPFRTIRLEFLCVFVYFKDIVEKKEVYLIYPYFIHDNYSPSLSPGLLSIAAQVERYFPSMQVTIWDERISGPFRYEKIEGALVGISAMTAQVPRAVEIAREAIKAGAYGVLFGGIHPTVCAQEMIAYGSVLRGEVENDSIKEVLTDYQLNRRLKDVYYRPVTSLDHLPLASSRYYRYALLGSEDHVSDSRGCPFSCKYCSVHITAGKKIRHRPIDEVVHELKVRGILEGNSERVLVFTNDHFGFTHHDIELLKRLRDALDSKPIQMLIQAGLTTLNDDRFLELLNSLGYIKLAIGVESPLRQELATVKEGIEGVDPVAVFVKIRRYPNLSTWLLLMVGFDFEPADCFEKVLDYIIQLKPDGSYISILTPLPGTAVAMQLEEEGRIIDRNWANYDTRHLVFKRKYRKNETVSGYMDHDDFMQGYEWLINQAADVTKQWSKFQTRIL
jgi:radical SAM superfamily enzyme YgiQ (UPF0313 family)